MRKIYILMAVAAITLVGCKNNGNKKAGEGIPDPAAVEEAVEAAADEAALAATTDAEAVRAEVEKIAADLASGAVETVEETLAKNPDAVIPFTLVENKPTFDGGDANDFSGWVNSHITYPQGAIDDHVEGRVILGFTVAKDGTVQDVKVLRGVNELLDQEAVRVVSSSPKWEPASQNGNPVAVNYTFPVVFKLQ